MQFFEDFSEPDEIVVAAHDAPVLVWGVDRVCYVVLFEQPSFGFLVFLHLDDYVEIAEGTHLGLIALDGFYVGLLVCDVVDELLVLELGGGGGGGGFLGGGFREVLEGWWWWWWRRGLFGRGKGWGLGKGWG